MTSNEKTLCAKLIQADTEEAVIKLLQDAGYWDNPDCWRDLGDNENNFAIAGAQQSDSVPALVEKLVNSIDARLMNECRMAGIDPEGDKAPPSPRHAVAQLIQELNPENESNGIIENMLPWVRTQLARQITLSATGEKKRPSITIVDEGEGQTPDRVPDTFMSLNKSNKLRVNFVQGRYNMGGAGALHFCGEKHMQLIVTRRNPAILDGDEEDGELWGFTVVRIEEPTTGERNEVYRYLAPIGADSKRTGGILRFAADMLPVKPRENTAYKEPLRFGSLVKLYEYQLKRASNILERDELLRQVDLRLPAPRLPVMFHECRNYGGNKGDYSKPCNGLIVRLADNNNLADGFPCSDVMTVDGQKFTITYYGFKEGKADTYRKKADSVLFIVNGQTQATLPSSFYSRKNINFGYISDSLLTVVDCSKIGPRANEKLFMNNREFLAKDSPFQRKVESALENLVAKNPALKAFNSQRREEKISRKFEDNKAFEDVIKSVFQKSPTLSALFLTGNKLSDPSKIDPPGILGVFEGRESPTFFHLRNRKPGDVLSRECEKGRQIRIRFVTDAQNNYLHETKGKGRCKLSAHNHNGEEIAIREYHIYLHNGTATLHITPPDVGVGTQFTVTLSVTDNDRVTPFENRIELTMIPRVSKPDAPSKPAVTNLSGLSLPNVQWVDKSEWSEYGFNEYSALKAIPSGEKENHYDFYINADNIYLRTELENARGNEDLLRKQFGDGLALIGLALIHEASKVPNANAEDIADQVETATRAVALMLIPLIHHLGELTPDRLATIALAEAA